MSNSSNLKTYDLSRISGGDKTLGEKDWGTGSPGRIYMSRQSYKKTTIQIRIDASWHKYLKLRGAQDSRSIKDLVEECLSDYYDLDAFIKVEQKRIK